MSSAGIVIANRARSVAHFVEEADYAPEKKASHKAIVMLIGSAAARIMPHPDPDTTSLELVLLNLDANPEDEEDYGYQVVVKKGQFKDGDLAVYIQPDSVVPQTEPFKFIWEQYVGIDGTVPAKRRRITVRKFRGEWSEGLLLPITDFAFQDLNPDYVEGEAFVAGEDVSDMLQIGHYDPDEGKEDSDVQATAPKRKFRYPRTFRGWVSFIFRFFKNGGSIKEATRDVPFVIPEYDVDNFKNYKGTFVEGETVVVTEKIHGQNARFIYLDGQMYAGSKSQWKMPGGNDNWNKTLRQNPWITNWCIAHPGYALYGEITPTQKGFDYGTKDVMQFFMFDIRTPDNTWVDFDDYHLAQYDLELFNDHMVPVLYYGPYDHDLILTFVDGNTEVAGAKHIREGVVVATSRERRARGLSRAQLKIVSNAYLLKDLKN